MTELTEEQRIAIIRHAHQNSKKISPPQSIQDFIGEIMVEQLLCDHGSLDVKKEDLEDESQFFLTESAEDIDEEDQDFGLSDEMKRVYDNN